MSDSNQFCLLHFADAIENTVVSSGGLSGSTSIKYEGGNDILQIVFSFDGYDTQRLPIKLDSVAKIGLAETSRIIRSQVKQAKRDYLGD